MSTYTRRIINKLKHSSRVSHIKSRFTTKKHKHLASSHSNWYIIILHSTLMRCNNHHRHHHLLLLLFGAVLMHAFAGVCCLHFNHKYTERYGMEPFGKFSQIFSSLSLSVLFIITYYYHENRFSKKKEVFSVCISLIQLVALVHKSSSVTFTACNFCF